MKEYEGYLEKSPYLYGQFATQKEEDEYEYFCKVKNTLLSSEYIKLIEWFLRM